MRTYKKTKLLLASALTVSGLSAITAASSHVHVMEAANERSVDVSENDPFVDIGEDYWAFKEINWAVGQGLIFGYDDDTFRPSEKATQAQFLAILTRFAGEQLDESESEGHWADVHYNYLEEHNFPIVEQASDRERNQPARRGDIARIISAYIGEDLSETEAIQHLYDLDLSTGRDGNQTIDGFGADDSLTRAQLVTFMYRMAEKGYSELEGLENPPSDHEDDDKDDTDNGSDDSNENDKPQRVNVRGTDYASTGEELESNHVQDIETLYDDFQSIAADTKFSATMDKTPEYVMLQHSDKNMNVTASYGAQTQETAKIVYADNRNHEGFPILAKAAHAAIPAVTENHYLEIIKEAHEITDNFTKGNAVDYYQESSQYLINITETSMQGVTVIMIRKGEQKEGDE
ncbi:S-layer homology domain-containing protein [Salibacterium aidingense]|uniref:S-layer homology domain-containing protein n=1 Tax=Salibacterium aidingense TaxID=384933 RepID=UPI0003F9F071|nr:S-layer homology domain-containing protein [Salibacterium aidingense]